MDTNNTLMLLLYFKEGCIPSFLDAIWDLPNEIRPTKTSLDECGKRSPINDIAELHKLWDENPYGFFLFADKCEYNIMQIISSYQTVFIDTKKDFNADIHSETIFEKAVKCGMVFGFAAYRAEYYHRNRTYLVRLGGDCETWIGRDLKNSLPGLFWMTSVSEAYTQQKNIPLDLIKDSVVKQIPGPDGDISLLMRFYEKPEDWQENKKRLDGLCYTMDGVFSMKQIKQKLHWYWTFNRTLNFLRDYR